VIDAEALAYGLLERDQSDATVRSDIDVTVMDEFPFVSFSIVVGQSIDNHAPPSGWFASLTINIFDLSLDAAKARARRVYDQVWQWADPFEGLGTIPDIGRVSDVADQSIFTRVATADVEHKWVTQYAGSFELTVRPPQ
jgi:hypothetical protein